MEQEVSQASLGMATVAGVWRR